MQNFVMIGPYLRPRKRINNKQASKGYNPDDIDNVIPNNSMMYGKVSIDDIYVEYNEGIPEDA